MLHCVLLHPPGQPAMWLIYDIAAMARLELRAQFWPRPCLVISTTTFVTTTCQQSSHCGLKLMAMTMFSCIFVVGVFGLQWRLINKYCPVTSQKAGQQHISHHINIYSLTGMPMYQQPWQFQLSAHNYIAHASPCDMAAMSLPHVGLQVFHGPELEVIFLVSCHIYRRPFACLIVACV